MIKQKLAKLITSNPDVIQFAKDRKYEDSWIVPVSKDKPTEKEINDYLEKEKFDLLIVEYIWNSKDDDKRFVLTIFLDKKCKLQDSRRFIDACFDLFYEYRNFLGLIKSLDQLIMGKQFLFQHPIEAVIMGIFNHWMSVGPIELWRKGEKYNFDNVVEKIKSRPEVEKSKLNYQGLLFQFNMSGDHEGPYHGIKTPCCSKDSDLWVVDFKKVGYWINLILFDKQNSTFKVGP